MKKKTIKLTSLMTLCSVLLAGCGMTTNTDTENSTAAINEGGVVNNIAGMMNLKESTRNMRRI